MWKYIRKYLNYAVIAGIFMVGEVLMDLLQPEIMSSIVDDGVLGVDTGGVGDLHLIWTLGLQMIGLVLFGGLCGSLKVLVDGVDVREYEQKDLRDKIAIALQKSELFSQRIRENISWGKPEASSGEIVCAAKAAQADSFIQSTPEGYETMVAERGMSLSGGQKQRVSIARAVVKNAEILILDDSVSALELKTEADLYTALKKISPDSTKIIIAQRIASVRHADRIVVLADGGIETCGTHEELLETSKTYRDIYDSQLGEEDDYGK